MGRFSLWEGLVKLVVVGGGEIVQGWMEKERGENEGGCESEFVTCSLFDDIHSENCYERNATRECASTGVGLPNEGVGLEQNSGTELS